MIPFARLRRAGLALAAALLGLAALPLVAPPAQAQATASTLVSNTGQTVLGTRTSVDSHWIATAFTTGSHSTGYTLSEIDLFIGNWNGNAAHFSANVYSASSAGVPDSQLCTLVNPGSPADNALNTFTGPTAAGSTCPTLDASTTYAVVLKSSSASKTVSVAGTNSDNEDSGAASGWSIADRRAHSNNSGNSWSRDARVLVFAVKGSEADAPEGPEVSSASVDGDMLAIVFDENFDTASKPAADAFLVASRGEQILVRDVGIADATVTLTLDRTVGAAETVKVYYTQPSTNPLQNASGDKTVSFSRQEVTNNTGSGTPSISSVAVVSKPRHQANGDASKKTYPTDQPIVVEVTWDQDVTWDTSASGAEMRVPLTIGTATRHAKLVTGGASSGTADSLWFSYTVGAGSNTDTDSDGVAVTATGGNVVILHSGATLKNAQGTQNAGLSHAGLGNQADHKVDSSVAAVSNNAPTYNGNAPGTINAPPGSLVTSPGLDFNDADGDTLIITLSATSDVYLLGDPRYIPFLTRVAATARPACVLANLTPAITSVHSEDITITATDPDGASVSATWTTLTAFDDCPSFSSAEVDGNTLTLTLDGAPNAESYAPSDEVMAAGEFTVKVGSAAVGVEAVAVSGSTAVLTLAQAVTPGASVTVSYAPGDYPAAVAFPDQTVTNNTTGLAVISTTVDASDGTTVTLTFNASLAAPTAAVQHGMRHAFVIQGGYWSGIPIRNQSPNGVAISGSTVTLTLGAPIPVGGEATVGYDPGIAAAYGGMLQNTQGDELDSFTVVATRTGSGVPTLVSAVVEGAVLALVFDRELDSSSAPAGSRFELNVRGLSSPIRGTGTAAVSGTRVRVALASAPAANTSATMYYENGDDANPLRSASSGPLVGDISGMLVYPVATAAPVLTSSVVAGNKAVLYYGEMLDPGSTPATSAYTVTAAGSAVTVSDVAVSGDSVVLSLGSSVAASASATLTYTAGTNPIQDLAGNDAANLPSQTLTNRGPTDAGMPALTGASVQGRVLTLTFDHELDPTAMPAPSAFTTSDPWWTVERVTVRGNELELRLNDAVTPCSDRFTVNYTAPAADVVANLWGTAASAFTGETVTYGGTGTCAHAWENSWTGSIVLSATRPFDTGFEPQPEWFTVAASGGPATVTAAEYSPDDAHLLVLSVSREFAADETITVSYRRPRGQLGLWTVDGDQLADLSAMAVENRVDWSENEAPVFRGRSHRLHNALPGFLVSLPMRQSDFTDPDGDPLTFSLTASRHDVFAHLPHMGLPDGFSHNERLGRVFFVAKTACALAHVAPPAGGAYDTVITMTATDPDGETAHATATFRTDPTVFACPALSRAAVDDTVVTLVFDAELAPSYADPQASDFTVTADGIEVAVTEATPAEADIWSDTGDTITLTLASPVWGGQDVAVSYLPGGSPVAAAFAGHTATNNSPPPPEPLKSRQLEQSEEPFEPDPEVIEAVRGYARETSNGFEHVRRWIRVLKTLGAFERMTAAEARDHAGRHLAARWNPVADELQKLERAPGAYEPDPEVIEAVWRYARETRHGPDHVLRWMRVLQSFGEIEDMTVAEAQGYADQYWALRWDPVVQALAEHDEHHRRRRGAGNH